ncbi:MAG: GNAT family N-acetyltransferase [Armatimonadaceae bacterium]
MSTSPSAPVVVETVLSEADRDAITRIRTTVFVEEQQVPPEIEQDPYDATALHWIARDSETKEPLGTARLVDRGNGVGKIGRVAVLPEHRGRGIGNALMHAVVSQAREHRFAVLMLDAQVHVVPFYERLGFAAEGPEFLEAGILHRRMTRFL